MDEMGKAMMGTGEASGEDRAVQAAEKAIANPLLDEISLNGARGVLINVTGGYDMTLFELDEAANIIRDKVDNDANIIVGSTLDPEMEGKIRVSVVATGIDTAEARLVAPTQGRMSSGFGRPLPTPRPAEPAPVAATQPVVTEPHTAAASPNAARADALRAAIRTNAASAEAQPAAPRFAPAAHSDQTADRPNDATNGDLFAAPTQHMATPEVIGADDVPPPAYQPRPTDAQSRVDGDAAAFVAPNRPQPGVPTLETLERLRAAVNRAPSPSGRMVAAAPLGARNDEKSRFGLGNLINRMSGVGASGHGGLGRGASGLDGSDTGADDTAADGEQDRVEIPAFLRRQAN